MIPVGQYELLRWVLFASSIQIKAPWFWKRESKNKEVILTIADNTTDIQSLVSMAIKVSLCWQHLATYLQ